MRSAALEATQVRITACLNIRSAAGDKLSQQYAPTCMMTSAAAFWNPVGSSRCVGMPRATENALAVPRGTMPSGIPAAPEEHRLYSVTS